MSGVYTVQFSGVAVAASVDLFELVAHASKPLNIIGFRIGQTTREGDANEAILTVALKSGQTTGGSGGASVTPNPTDTSLGAAGFTATRASTTKASAGTIVTHYVYDWNVRGPLDIILPEPQQILLAAGRRATLELVEAPPASMTISGYMVCQEIG